MFSNLLTKWILVQSLVLLFATGCRLIVDILFLPAVELLEHSARHFCYKVVVVGVCARRFATCCRLIMGYVPEFATCL